MFFVFVLGHLIGDYVLQWDRLARWKRRSVRGVAVHGALVSAATVGCVWLVEPAWWLSGLVAGATHFVIDSVHFALINRPTWFQRRSAVFRFIADQAVHLLVLALVAHRLAPTGQAFAASAAGRGEPSSVWVWLGYIFLTMPAWVLIEHIVPWLVDGTGPDFVDQADKYLGILERLVILTLLLLGQGGAVLLALAPRLFVMARAAEAERTVVVVQATKLMASVLLAVGTGFALRGAAL